MLRFLNCFTSLTTCLTLISGIILGVYWYVASNCIYPMTNKVDHLSLFNFNILFNSILSPGKPISNDWILWSIQTLTALSQVRYNSGNISAPELSMKLLKAYAAITPNSVSQLTNSLSSV